MVYDGKTHEQVKIKPERLCYNIITLLHFFP
jgi:ribosomal protein S19